MNRITPFLWFEKDMKAVTDFYMSAFPGSSLKGGGELENTPSGAVQMATLVLYGQEFSLMTAGPYLPFNPTVSFIVGCDSTEELDSLWGKIAPSGKVLMELGSYPFAEKYGWAQDQYGVSWQIMFSSAMKAPQKIIPTLMFAGDVCGRAEEAVNFYTSIFKNSSVGYIQAYDGSEPVNDERAKTKHAGLSLDGFNMAVMDSGRVSPLNFQQAVSFVINCENQEEVDYYYDKLKEGGNEVQCGWLNDKFGFPWQVVPAAMGKMMSTGTKEQIGRVTEVFMKMKKFDIKTLEDAFNG